MLLSIFFLLAGLILLTVGGNLLVDGSISLAKKWKISEAVIGLTIVAIGTSMPELIVSLLASISGNTDIAIGNVLGSNIANIFLILGITAIVAPINLSATTRFFDLPVNILVSILLGVIVSDIFLDGLHLNLIGRIDGIILLSFAVIYILYSLKHNNFIPSETDEVERILSSWKAILWVLGGIGVLFIGGKILVTGAVDLAKMVGISESIIGLTIVAIGTSTPEMITSIIAAKRGKPDIAVGNIVGSNIMNILVILGVSAFIAPLPFKLASFIDLFMAFIAPVVVLVLSLVWTRNKLERRDGITLVIMYLIYLGYLISEEIL
ncbi:MAG: calcium/sodium antiporter [Candidatus Altimarinota bacterium]